MSIYTNSLILLPFYRWGNWGMQRLSDLSKVTQLAHGGVIIWSQTTFPAILSMPCCLISLLTFPSRRESLVWMLLSQFDTWAKLMDTVTQTQKKGIVGPFFKVTVTKRAKPREGWAQAKASFSQDVGPSLCGLGMSHLSLDCHSFTYTMKGWAKAFPFLTFQRLTTCA